MLALALILDFGRIALGLHYPADVLGGSAIGAAAAVLLWLPPLRRLIGRISDSVGGIGDAAVDSVLGRPRERPRGARTLTEPDVSSSSLQGANRVQLGTRKTIAGTRTPIAGEARVRA